jgi:chaperonin GroEL
MLEDIAVLTNGKALTEDLGLKLENMKLEDLGQAKKITIDKDNTTIVEGAGTPRRSPAGSSSFARRSRTRPPDYDREKLQERLAKLVGGVGHHQGRGGDRDRDEGKEGARRGRDARDQGRRRRGHRRRWRCRVTAGVSGARPAPVTGEEQVGVNIIRRAIEEPMRWIAANAGHEGSIVVQRVKEMKDNEGFNAQTEQYEDLVAAGVIDPAKVVRSALQHAASIASLLLTTKR